MTSYTLQYTRCVTFHETTINSLRVIGYVGFKPLIVINRNNPLGMVISTFLLRRARSRTAETRIGDRGGAVLGV
jgi:hypothetical protein